MDSSMCLLAFLVRFDQPEVTEVAIMSKSCAFPKQACMGHISGTEWPIQLILVSNERYRCLGVYVGTSGQIWSTGSGQNITKMSGNQVSMGHISGMDRPIHVILVAGERPWCLDMSPGTSGQIRWTGSGPIGQIVSKIFVRPISWEQRGLHN